MKHPLNLYLRVRIEMHNIVKCTLMLMPPTVIVIWLKISKKKEEGEGGEEVVFIHFTLLSLCQ